MSRAVLRELLFAALAAALGCAVFAIAPRACLWVSGPFHWGAEIIASWWRSGAIAGPVLLVVAFSYPLRALRASRRPDGASMLRPLGALGGATAALAAAETWWHVHGLRAAAIRAVPDHFFYPALELLVQETWLIASLADLAICLVLLWTAAGVAFARPRDALALAAAIAPAVVAGLAMTALLRAEVAAIAWADPCGSAETIHQLRYDAFSEHGAPLAAVRTWLLAAAIAGTITIVALARRERRLPAPDRMALAASGGLFAVGLVAFALTRGEAHDADSPPPLWDPLRRTHLAESQTAVLPLMQARSGDACDAPTLELHPRGWIVDGVLTPTPEAVSEMLGAKRKLWEQLQSHKRFPGVVALAMPPETPLRAALPMIEAARRAGYDEVRALGRIPQRRWPTRTLGDVAYVPRLGCMTLPATLPEDGSWGELLSRTGR